MAVSYQLGSLQESSANHFVDVFDTAGTRTGTTLSRARRAAAARATRVFFGWHRGFLWNEAGTFLAGLMGSAALVVRAPDCSVAAVFELQTEMREYAQVSAELYGQLQWMPGHSKDLIVCVHAEQRQSMGTFSLVTQQLRWDHAAALR